MPALLNALINDLASSKWLRYRGFSSFVKHSLYLLALPFDSFDVEIAFSLPARSCLSALSLGRTASLPARPALRDKAGGAVAGGKECRQVSNKTGAMLVSLHTPQLRQCSLQSGVSSPPTAFCHSLSKNSLDTPEWICSQGRISW